MIARIHMRIKRRFIQRFGYVPNLHKPKSYCEKMQWLKLNINSNNPKVIERADKFLVRNYIKEMGFSEHLVTLYGVYDKPEEIDWNTLPQRFVLKLNNASGPNYRWFVEDKSTFSISKFTSQANSRLHDKYGSKYGEFHYGKIPPKIIAEEYLEDSRDSFIDYSFYCFHGKVVFLSVEEGKREGRIGIEYYNTNWEKHPVDFFNDYPRVQNPFQKPANFDRMILIAETLSRGYPHLRVDLYNVGGHIYFGELTYTPESGFIEWNPVSLDYEYGKLIDIHNISH